MFEGLADTSQACSITTGKMRRNALQVINVTKNTKSNGIKIPIRHGVKDGGAARAEAWRAGNNQTAFNGGCVACPNQDLLNQYACRDLFMSYCGQCIAWPCSNPLRNSGWHVSLCILPLTSLHLLLFCEEAGVLTLK